METTLTKYREATARNYCTLPTVDVPILPREPRCECGAAIVWDRHARIIGAWVHVSDDVSCDYARPIPSCMYCNATGEAVTFHAMPYSNETHCARCGGVNGYGIGD